MSLRFEDVLHMRLGRLGSLVQNTHLNFDGTEKDFGRDPMTGFLKALSHNPGATTQFFNATEPQENAHMGTRCTTRRAPTTRTRAR